MSGALGHRGQDAVVHIVASDARQSRLLHGGIQSKPAKGVLSLDRNRTRNMRNVERD